MPGETVQSTESCYFGAHVETFFLNSKLVCWDFYFGGMCAIFLTFLVYLTVGAIATKCYIFRVKHVSLG